MALAGGFIGGGSNDFFFARDRARARYHRYLRALAADNADLASASQAGSVRMVVDDLFTGDTSALADPNLETGHYDDGHAFGWTAKTRNQQFDLWRTLTTAVINKHLDGLISALESKVGTDLDADGVVGVPSGGSGSTTSCTAGGQTCTVDGASCSGGSTCSGQNAACTGAGTQCTGPEDSCSTGATCSGQGATCTGSGTTCSGSDDSCSNGSACSGPSATCTGSGTQCTQQGDTCSTSASCPSSSPCTAQATTGSQAVAGPPNSSSYGYTKYTTVVPVSCTTASGQPIYSAYLIDDADGSLLACHVGSNRPIVGEPSCPGNNWGATINGDTLNPPAFWSDNTGATYWTLAIASSGYHTTPTLVPSAHLIYSFQSH